MWKTLGGKKKTVKTGNHDYAMARQKNQKTFLYFCVDCYTYSLIYKARMEIKVKIFTDLEG